MVQALLEYDELLLKLNYFHIFGTCISIHGDNLELCNL